VCTTLWGQPSGPILQGTIGRLEIIFFLPLKGQGHEKDLKNPKKDLGLKKRRGWLKKFSEAPILSKKILTVNAKTYADSL
jgi:hypothetical protein